MDVSPPLSLLIAVAQVAHNPCGGLVRRPYSRRRRSVRLRGRVVAPPAGVGVSLAGLVAVTALLVIGPPQTSIYPVVVSTALGLSVGVVSAIAMRRAGRRPSHPAARTAARTSVGGLIVGAFLLAGLVTPALAATPIGSDAPGADVNEVFLHGHGGH